ncbi:hypothetical protein OKA04_14065 [Luteolibacter flavescens]|uniref:Uncharacterized protein n=1 Tax=Luteolibacter flavescens TaxID=1859460 RepID=A0ABT3FRK4_9BACT|nr:hypothetical protein [Luteolibacter flavescens]MCW1885861.1 hypothetical protein [Luteolibacter flavescens]
MMNATRLVVALALAGACLGWLPEEKGKRKTRMAALPVPAADATRPA